MEENLSCKDHRRWILFDTKTEKTLISLAVYYNPDKWKDQPAPKDSSMKWSKEVSKAIVLPTACAKALMHSFHQKGHDVQMLLI
jgi:hypothetical protein